MARGDQQRRVRHKRQLDEPGYYAFASVVGQQRHFNVQTAKLLAAYGFDPLLLLDGVGRPLPSALPSEAVMEWIIEESNCPMTILRAYVDVGGDEQADTSSWGVLATGLRSTTEASLRRWGDVNHFTPQLLRHYCAPDGTPLDVQVLGLDGELTPEDCWQFILAHPRGQLSYRPCTLGHQLAEAFHRAAGFRLTYAYAVNLVELMRRRHEPVPDDDDCPF